MHFSCKIRKFCEGMQVYENLLEDEEAMHIPFALSFIVTIVTIVGQMEQFLIDLKNKVCREIPDIHYAFVEHIHNIMSPKFERDMASYGNMTLREYIEKKYGEFLDMTFPEIYRYIYDHALKMTELVKVVRREIKKADPVLFKDYVLKRIHEGNWNDVKENYQEWKDKYSEVTLDMLLERQERELEKYLKKGIMCFEDEPSVQKMNSVDYDYHRGHLNSDFVHSTEYHKAYTNMVLKYATRKDGMLIVDLKKYGKYISNYFYQFTESQKVALIEVLVSLDLIHQDMAQFVPSNCKFDGTALPEVLATPEAMLLWEKVQKKGYVDMYYQPTGSRPEAAVLAYEMALRLGIEDKWKAFETLWGRRNMYRDYHTAINQRKTLKFRDKIRAALG